MIRTASSCADGRLAIQRTPAISRLVICVQTALADFDVPRRVRRRSYQSLENPLGVGGMRLHEWVFPLRRWRAMHGMDGGEVNESSAVVEESLTNIGATIMGRNMFGGGRGPGTQRSLEWMVGDEPPFHHPVFVLTHHAREPLALKAERLHVRDSRHRSGAGAGATRRRGSGCLTRGRGAGRSAVSCCGVRGRDGDTFVPTLLGSGERLFDGIGDDLHGLQLVQTVAARAVTHLKFARR